MGFDTDLALVVGIIVGVFALPGVLSALIDGRPPRAAMIAIVVAGVALVYALQTKHGGYELADIPGVFAKVIGRYLN